MRNPYYFCIFVCVFLIFYILYLILLRESGRLDLNQRPPAPQAGALANCATPRSIILIIKSLLVNTC